MPADSEERGCWLCAHFGKGNFAGTFEDQKWTGECKECTGDPDHPNFKRAKNPERPIRTAKEREEGK